MDLNFTSVLFLLSGSYSRFRDKGTFCTVHGWIWIWEKEVNHSDVKIFTRFSLIRWGISSFATCKMHFLFFFSLCVYRASCHLLWMTFINCFCGHKRYFELDSFLNFAFKTWLTWFTWQFSCPMSFWILIVIGFIFVVCMVFWNDS